MIPELRLGLRFLRGSELALRLRSVLAAVAAAVCVIVSLSIFAAWHAAEVGQSRSFAQSPHQDPDGTLLFYTVADSWHGRELTRDYVAAIGTHPPVPPGMSRVPSPGEVALSPNLAAALKRDDPGLTARFGGRRVLVIGRRGLTNANQQLAYIGAKPLGLRGAERISAFNDRRVLNDSVAKLSFVVLLVFLLFVAAPFAGVCAVATRLGSAARRRRLAALWTIGISPQRLRFAAAVESTVAVAAGSVAGVGVFALLRSEIARHSSLGGVRPFAADLRVPAVVQVATVLCAVAIAIVSGALLGGSRAWSGVRPSRVPRSFDRSPVLLLCGGSILAAVTATGPELGLTGTAQDVALDATGLSLTVGASLSLAFLIQRGGRWTASRWSREIGLIAARRLELNPGAMARLGACILPAIFAIGFAATVATQFSANDPAARANLDFHGRRIVSVQAANLPGGVLSTDGLTGLAAVPFIRTRSGAPIVVASCDQLRVLSGQPGLRCPDGSFALTLTAPAVSADGGGLAIGGGPARGSSVKPLLIRSSSGRTLSVPEPSQAGSISIAMPTFENLRVTVVPPGYPGLAQLGKLPVTMVLTAAPAHDAIALATLRTSIAEHDPLGSVNVAGADALDAASSYGADGTTVMLLALILCAVGASGVAMVALDEVLARRQQLAPLLVIGVGRPALRRSTVIEVATPLVLAVLSGTGLATLCSWLFVQQRVGIAHVAVATLGATAAVGVVVGVSIAVIAAVLVPPTPNRVGPRME